MSEETMSEIKNMSKVAQGEVVQWRHDTMPWGVWRRGVAEIWDHEAECWYVRDTEGFLVRVAPADENILPSKDGLPISTTEQIAALRLQVNTCEEALKLARSNGKAAHDSLCLAEKGHAEAQDALESLRDEHERLKLDHAALTETFNEVNAAYHKAHNERHALNTQNAEARAEVESAAREGIDRLQGFLSREIANHEAADKLARKLGDELHVLRAKLASMEAADSEECARLRKLIKETTEIAIQRGREAEAARHEAARHERRAASWQGAAQDALSQMEEMINNARAHAPGRG